MIQIDRETFQMMLHQIMERFDKIEDKLGRMNRQTSALDGDKLLDNQDMCELLGITKRTLARYRQKKLVTYYMIDGRTYYKSSEVKEFLNRKGQRTSYTDFCDHFASISLESSTIRRLSFTSSTVCCSNL